jgi:hypothetical protein
LGGEIFGSISKIRTYEKSTFPAGNVGNPSPPARRASPRMKAVSHLAFRAPPTTSADRQALGPDYRQTIAQHRDLGE